MDRETVVSKGNRDRDQNVVSKDYTKLKQTWKIKNWEKRDSDIDLYEINQEFESQRLQLQQANQWADHAQRDKIACMENWK